MLCKSCGKQLRDKATFCPYCGTKVEKEDADTEKKRLIRKMTGIGIFL